MAPPRRALATAVAALGLLALTVRPTSATPTAPSTPAPTSAPPAVTKFKDPATGSTALTNLGAANGWKVLTSATATQSGGQISTPGFSTAGWLNVADDGGGAPGTEINALLQNGSCPNIFSSTTMKSCFGQLGAVGDSAPAPFNVPWWYRTDFTAPPAGQDATLVLNGVIGAADVWVNGSQVAAAADVTGGYARNAFDITKLLTAGTNSLAIDVHPNNPNNMLTVDNVDWTQIPPDNNTGIQFPVQLQTGGPLVDGNAHVVQNTAADLSSSALTVKTDVTNTSSTAQTGTATATVTPPGGGTPITVSQSVTVPAGATRTVTFATINLTRPQIWWPYQLGAQPLYTLATAVAQNSSTLGSTSETFGIRTVDSYLTGASTAAPDGVRAFKINGTPLVIRGGGWDPDLFLRYDPADTTKQIALLKAMGVNTVRLEGHFMPDDWYQQMDAAGILVNAGYQCCDFWEAASYTSAQQSLYQLTAQTLGQTLRNHPSVFSFQWSDNAPTAGQETLALKGFAAADYSGPFISSAEYNSSPQLGTSGEKEGPYDWVPPNYWYDTSHYDSGDSTLTNAGGSWGYDSEQSGGNTIPTLDSIRRFLSPAEQAALWQSPSANQYHDNYEGTSHTNYHFGTNYNLDTAITDRYGAPSSLAQYVEEAQVQNYEDTRAQFEAFIDHSTNTTAPATGTVYWQLNKGWPTLLWSLYNNDGDQAGAYFGAQQANRPLHALYALDNNTVTLDNLGGQSRSGVSVEAKVYNTAGAVLDDQTASGLTLSSQQVANAVLKPKLPTAANTVYFVELLVKQNGTLVDRNVYWNSTTPDAVNWSKSIGQPQSTMTSYANLKALQSLPQAGISATASTSDQTGAGGGADRLVTVTVTNTSTTPTVGFFLRADIRRGTASGTELSGDNELQSSIWNDNDVTLWPGESETLTASYNSADLQGATPVVSLSGWNAPKIDVVAGTATGGTSDFSLQAAPATGSVAAGSTATATVATAVTAGGAEPVALSATGAPSGATLTLNPTSVTSGGSSTLTVATSASTPAGSYPITVTGTAASGSHSAGYTLTVTPAGSGCTPVQLLGNPGFENGSKTAPWTQSSTTGSSPINDDTADEPTHSGSWDAWLDGDSKADTDTLAQSVTIPTGCSAALSYWLHVDTTESTSGKADDTLQVQVLDTSGNVLGTVGSFSNLDAHSGYTQHTADLSAYAGRTVTLRFTGTETDANGGTTSFVLDDTALQTS
ncbi:glycosyl hydrolase 2 galactose-binding domain-containing protein [Kitasatospora sp. NBC_01266]|uniref:glycosyl hydrolase 2 galactose-binding domain-containing protein n=1 Tax=Kitasatospora sp. NBC_01266 TaxID=2903572 RepID=UPI002E30CA23|nr:beta-mannosidase [Kitasatospora sp. NBC_01266]